MNKLVFITLISFSFSCWSQEDTLMPSVSGNWQVKTWVGYPNNIYSGYTFYSDSATFLYKDTLWGSNSYGLHLVDSGRVYFKAWDGNGLPYYANNDTLTHLLYDYNTEVGDTAYFDQSEGFPVKLDSIGVSDFLGDSRKAWYFSAFGSNWDIWIQGMGSVHGFFFPWGHTFEGGNELCFFEGEYVDSLGTPFSLSYDNPDICETLTLDERDLIVKMQCFNYKVNIELQNPEILRIYSYDGKLVYEVNCTVGFSEVDLSFLRKGAYIINIGSVYSNKFVRI